MKTKRIVTGWIMAVAIASISFMLGLQGCGSEMATGVGIGVGASSGFTEAQRIARQSKIELAAEVGAAREKLAHAASQEESEKLTKDLAVLQKKQEVVNVAEAVTNKLSEGMARNWSTPDPKGQRDNIMWAVDAVLVGLFGWQTRKRKVFEKSFQRALGESTPQEAKELYDAQKVYAKRIIP